MSVHLLSLAKHSKLTNYFICAVLLEPGLVPRIAQLEISLEKYTKNNRIHTEITKSITANILKFREIKKEKKQSFLDIQIS